MIWPNDISFEAFQKKIDDWYADKHSELCDPHIDAQDHYYTYKPLDLCPSCKDSFEKWLNKKGD